MTTKIVKAYICCSHEHGCDCIEVGVRMNNCHIKNKGEVTNGYFVPESDYRKMQAVIRAARMAKRKWNAFDLASAAEEIYQIFEALQKLEGK